MNRPGFRTTSALRWPGLPISPSAAPRGRGSQRHPKEIEMRPTLFNMIVFALAFLLFNAGLIAIGYLLLK